MSFEVDEFNRCHYCRERIPLDHRVRATDPLVRPGLAIYAHRACEAEHVKLRAEQAKALADEILHSRCQNCGYTAPAGLCDRGGRRLCYECVLAEDGAPTVQNHHVLGRANDPMTVTTPANLHRDLEAMKREWPESLKRNVSRDPLLQIAALERSYGDYGEYAARHFRRHSDFLVALQEWLVRTHGENWYEEARLCSLWLPPREGKDGEGGV